MNQFIIAQHREEFMAVVDGLAAQGDQEMIALQRLLNDRKVLLANHTLQSSKLIGGVTSVIVIDPSANDDRDLGLRNFDKARLNKDEFFMVTSIQIEAATNASLTTAQLKSIKFGSIEDVGNPPVDGILQNGEANFRARSVNILRNFPLSNFVTGMVQSRAGDMALATRRIIRPADDIFFELRFGVAAPADYAVRVSLHGLVTVPNAG